MADSEVNEEIADPPTYEELAQIELDFEDVDTEIIARQEQLHQPIYARRSNLAKRIPNFWPLVFEQAPPEIDQYIQPSDSAVFAACLLDLTVTRFETGPSQAGSDAKVIKNPRTEFGEPRSLCFRFTFGPNEWFEDEVLEKKFWYRRAPNGWAGRVSEPVRIRWKKGKDLTSGLLDSAMKLFEAEQTVKSRGVSSKGKQTERKPKEYEALRQKVEASTEGSQSFFTWFGFRGPHVTAEESAEAVDLHEKKRQKAKNGFAAASTTGFVAAEDPDDDDKLTEEEKESYELRFAEDAEVEIFPDGEELAISIAEELWPSATKYFVAAQEDDGDLSDSAFEEDDDDDDGIAGRDKGHINADKDDNMEEDEVDEEHEDAIPDLRSLVREDLRGKGGGAKGGRDGNGDAGPPSKKRRT